MNKAILISIKPKWVAKILNGEKTIEVRKTMPKCDLPIDVYIYCTKEDNLCRICKIDKDRYICGKDFDIKDFPKLHSGYEGKGKVVAKFTLRKVECIDKLDFHSSSLCEQAGFTSPLDFYNYLGDCEDSFKILGYAYHIEDLVIFDKPKELSEFKRKHYPQYAGFVKNEAHYELVPLTKAPQSYCFVEAE